LLVVELTDNCDVEIIGGPYGLIKSKSWKMIKTKDGSLKVEAIKPVLRQLSASFRLIPSYSGP
jgi:hypothetical protein